MATLSGSAVTLLLKIGTGVLAVVGLGVLFFVSKYIRRWWQKRKSFKITATIYNPDGTFFIDKIGKFRTGDNIDKMLFMQMRESMPVIDPKYIISNQVTLWRYAPSQYAVIPPRIWGRNPKDFKIEVINFQMKNFAYLEQRAAVSRWAYIKNALEKYAPYITILLCLILGGIVIYFITKMAFSMFAEATAARLADCSQLVGGGTKLIPPV